MSAVPPPVAPEGKVRSYRDLRVVIAVPCFHIIDGVSVTIRKIMKAVKAAGGKVMIVMSKPSNGEKEEGSEYNDSLPMIDACCASQQDYRIGTGVSEELHGKLKAFCPNLIHITAPEATGQAFIVWGRENNVPVMKTWHSNVQDYTNHWGAVVQIVTYPFRRWLIWIVSEVRYTYVPTEFIRQKMIREGFEVKHTGNKLKVWGRGVDTEKFHPSKRSEAWRSKHGFTPDDVVVAWVSRCTVEKRPDIFIRAMTEVMAKTKNVKAVVCGRGVYYESMCELPNVIGLGWQSSEELPEVYASVDVLFFPSRVETFGNVTLEAMASGTSCVVAENCSSHLVESGYNGYAVKGLSHMGYTEAIITLAQDSKLREEMGKNGRIKAVRDYKVQKIMTQMLDNYVENANLPIFSPEGNWHLHAGYTYGVKCIAFGIWKTLALLNYLGPFHWVGICVFCITGSMLFFRREKEEGDEGSYSWIVGVVLATCAQLSGAVAKVGFKYYWKVKNRWKQILISAGSYFCIIVINPVMGLAAYSYAAQSLLAPLSILNLVWNAVLANVVLGEKLSKTNIVAYVLVCSGCLLSSYYGIHTHTTFTIDSLFALFWEPLFMAFIVFEAVVAYVAHERIKNGEKKYPAWIIRASYGCLAGMLGGNQFMSKSLSEFIHIAWTTDMSLFFSVGALLLIASTVIVLLSGLRVLQDGLKHYTAMSLIPIYQGFFTITMVVSALVFFKEYQKFTFKMAQAYGFSFFFIFAGICNIQPPKKKNTEQHVA